jgi:hypothetical protein
MAMSPKQTAAIVIVVVVLSVLIAISVIKQQHKNTSPGTNPYDSPFAANSYNFTSPASSYNSGWLPAKATWYGAPTGAGPVDNGKGLQHFKIFLPVFVQFICAMWLTNLS